MKKATKIFKITLVEYLNWAIREIVKDDMKEALYWAEGATKKIKVFLEREPIEE